MLIMFPLTCFVSKMSHLFTASQTHQSSYKKSLTLWCQYMLEIDSCSKLEFMEITVIPVYMHARILQNVENM